MVEGSYGQSHLAKLLLRSERLSSRFQMRFGRVLDDGGKLDAKHREDRVDDGDDGGRLVAHHLDVVLGTSPLGSPCSTLDREDRHSGDQPQTHLNRPVAGHILRSDSQSSAIEVNANLALRKSIFGHGAFSLAGPLQTVVALSIAGTVVHIFSILLRQLHLPNLLVGDGLLNWSSQGIHGHDGRYSHHIEKVCSN